MAFTRLKSLFLSPTKKLFLKAGYTVLHGDVRQSIRENAANLLPPSHLLQNARICTDRYAVLHKLPKGGTAVEIGVAYGDFTQPILDILQPDHFIAIDTFGITEKTEPWGRQLLKENHCSHYEYYTGRFRTLIEQRKMEVKQGLSWEKLKELPDYSIDYLYVDADHSYASVAKEIDALRSKMKSQGIVQFNDYTYFNHDAMEAYGVPRGVHEFMIAENYEMLYLCLHPQGFYDVVLRRLP